MDKHLEAFRAQYRAAALDGDQALMKISQSTMSSNWHTLAEAKGVLLLDALRRAMGDDAFYPFAGAFAAGADEVPWKPRCLFRRQDGRKESLFAKWLNETGLRSMPRGPLYSAGDLRRKLRGPRSSFTARQREAGTNRYAAVQWQKQFLDQFESAVPHL